LLRNSLRLGVAAFLTAALSLWFERIAYVWYPMLAVVTVMADGDDLSLQAARVRVLGTITGGLVPFLVHTTLAGWQSAAGTATLVSLMFLITPSHVALNWDYVFNRTLDTAIGCVIAILVGLLFWPRGGFDRLMRLFWTAAGILVALLSLRLFRTDLAVESNRQLELPTARRLRRQLVALRDAMPAVADELGNNPTSHATFRLFQLLNGAGSQLVGVFDGLRLLEHTPSDRGPLEGLHGTQAELLRVVADRLEQWNLCLEVPHRHRPAPPCTPLTPPPRWGSLERWLHDPDLDGLELIRLQRNASRLMLCGQALRSLEQAEHRWRVLGEPPR
jgi:uncharacterized membrane protein YccC